MRSIRGNHDEVTGWKLLDETPAVASAVAGGVEFPLTIRVQDVRGSILKMRVQL